MFKENGVTIVTFDAWRNAADMLHASVFDYVQAPRADRGTAKDVVVEAYGKALSFFMSGGEMVLKQQVPDMTTLVSFCASFRLGRAINKDRKEFVPVTSTAFRKALDSFFADRLANLVSASSCESVMSARKARREAIKAKKASDKRQPPILNPRRAKSRKMTGFPQQIPLSFRTRKQVSSLKSPRENRVQLQKRT